MLPYALMYRLGFAPWERRDVADTWRRLLEGTDAPVTGRALDVGCGSGRDAVYLAKQGWSVTAVDSVDKALASARRRAAEEGVEVQWVKGDVAALDRLGLEPGYNLLYDFGCIHGLSDAARTGAAAGLTHLAAPGATLLMVAFKAGRGIVLPRDEQAGRRRASTRWLGPRGKPVSRDRGHAGRPAPRQPDRVPPDSADRTRVTVSYTGRSQLPGEPAQSGLSRDDPPWCGALSRPGRRSTG